MMTLFNTLDDDALFNIMLNADIDTVTSICLTTNISYCDDLHFWKLYFGKNNLPILINPLPTTLSAWRREYKRVQSAALLTTELMAQLRQGYIINLNYTSHQMNFKNILPPHLRSAIFNFTPRYQPFRSIRIKYNGGYKIYMVNNLDSNDLNISNDDLYDILTIIFYHYPTIPYNIYE